MSDSNKSAGRLAARTSSCRTAHIFSRNCSVSKTSIVHEYDESVEIKEEIIDERHQDGEYNQRTVNRELDEFILSDKKSAFKAPIVYKYDETLEIKEEIIQDPETVSGQKIEKKYESTLNTVDIREADILAANKLRTHKEKKIREKKAEPGKENKCRKCGRSYKHKFSLNFHQKFECDVRPQFICKFCAKRFKRKSTMCRHVCQVHQKMNLNLNKRKFEEPKQESEANQNMYRHQKTNSNISQVSYNCVACGYETNMKSSLSEHISSRHCKNSKKLPAMHKCDKCHRSYTLRSSLSHHKRLKHAAFKQ